MTRGAWCIVAVFFVALSTHSYGQSWPSRPVHIVVPFAAGGPADLYARFLAQRLQGPLGQPFVVENRPGAGSVVGTNSVARSAPDGYTLLMMSNTHAVNETLIPNKPFELMRDLAPMAGVNYFDLLLVVHPSVPVNTLEEFIAFAKAKPKVLNYASSGPGTPYHMAGELFKTMAGVDIVHVPFKGSDGARLGVISGQVQMMFDAVNTMAPNARASKVKVLASTGRSRSALLPEVPTVAEAGLAGFEATAWLGLMAPAATPRPVLERVNAEVRKLIQVAEVREAWAKQGTVPMPMTIEQFDRFLRDEIAKWAQVVKTAGVKVD